MITFFRKYILFEDAFSRYIWFDIFAQDPIDISYFPFLRHTQSMRPNSQSPGGME